MSATRREWLAGFGGLLVSVAAGPGCAQRATTETGKPAAGGSLGVQPWLDAWVAIAPDGAATVFTGKAELGQGIRTAVASGRAQSNPREPPSERGAAPSER